MKGLATWDCFLCTQLLQMDHKYCAGLQTNVSCVLPESRHSYTYVNFMRNVTHMRFSVG